MNYRHAFHAGNFADLVKHAGLLCLLARLSDGQPLTVIDTHAGRGLYDLAGAEARKSAEAEAGIARLMRDVAAPAAFGALKSAVRALNDGDGEVRRYPGSPWLIANALRRQDRYAGCELRADEHAALAKALTGRANARAICADGYASAADLAPARGPVLALIDPPFERADDYVRIIQTVAALGARNPDAQAMIWLPIKDLETFDAFLRDLEDVVVAPILVAEACIRPLSDPLRMNGCALVLVNTPDIHEPLTEMCRWTAQTLGEGGHSRVYALQASRAPC